MTAPWKKNPIEHETPFLRYFDGEMRYLREAGREFAQAYPDAARRMGMLYGEPEGPVRAVYEGFAMLAARLRSKLDDGMPEVTDALLDNLYEYAARAIPSLSIVECTSLNRTGSTTAQIPAGAVVRSVPVGPDQVQCLYRTTQPVELLPLSVEDAVVAVRADGRTVIRLTFGLSLGEQRERVDLSRIRLYLHGDRPAAALYAALTRQVASISLRLPSVRNGELQRLDSVRFEAAGFGPSTRLWPVTNAERDQQLDREQTLLEYFAFPQKFHFVDLCGFDTAVLPAGEAQMTFEIELDGRMPGDHAVSRGSFRLFCTPVINLFEVDALPLQPVDWHDREHRVRVQPGVAEYVEPYDVLAVIAADPEDSARHAYQAFTSFRHRGWMLRYEKPERYFPYLDAFRRAGARTVGYAGGPAMGGHAPERAGRWRPSSPGPLPETVRALANNGRLPRMALTEATITETVSGFTGIASVRNLTAPTLPLYPPRHYPGYDWRVLGHFTAGSANELNRIHMEGAPALHEALELYDWAADDGVSRRIEAIRGVRFSEKQMLLRGYVQRVIRVHVELDATAFDGPGDAVLFGDVLSCFLGRYACFHHAMQLVLMIDGKETVYPRTDFEGAPF